MAYEDILYDARDGVAWLTINRPEVRNAFRAKTVDELIKAFRAAWADPEVGVVVLTGAGDKAFSAGGDQRERTQGGYTGGAGIGMDVHGLHGVIRAIPKPVIAMVNGYAIGGGHVLHVLCDLTIAADTAVFGQTGPRVGGGAARRVRTLVPGAARQEPDRVAPRQAVLQRRHRAHRGTHRARLQRARALLPDRRGARGTQRLPREPPAPLPKAALMKRPAL